MQELYLCTYSKVSALWYTFAAHSWTPMLMPCHQQRATIPKA